MRFKSNSEGDAVVQPGKESLSKSVLAELTGAVDLPEEVTILMEVWDNVWDESGGPFKASVVCVLDPEPATGKFYLRPKAGQIAAARANALAGLVEFLRKGVDRPNVSVWEAVP